MLLPSPGSNPGTWVSNGETKQGSNCVNPKTISVLLESLKSREIVTPEIHTPFFFVLKVQQDHGNLFCSEHNYDHLYNM